MLCFKHPNKKTRTSKSAGVKTITNKKCKTLHFYIIINRAKLAFLLFLQLYF
jgi:hypothetical protein